MTKPAQVASLADFAHDELGSIDLWCALSLPLHARPSECDLPAELCVNDYPSSLIPSMHLSHSQAYIYCSKAGHTCYCSSIQAYDCRTFGF